MPNLPSEIFFSTSSEDFPNIAVSTSWIAAALFIATHVMTFLLMRSTIKGDRPTLITCAPIIAITGLPRRLDFTTSSTNVRRSSATRICGRDFVKSENGCLAGSYTRAKAFGRTLLFRPLIEIVFILLRLICLYFAMLIFFDLCVNRPVDSLIGYQVRINRADNNLSAHLDRYFSFVVRKPDIYLAVTLK